jgi:hypothetical protein
MVGSAFGLLNHFERDGKLAWTDLPFTALGKRLPPLIAHLLMTVSLLYPRRTRYARRRPTVQEICLM